MVDSANGDRPPAVILLAVGGCAVVAAGLALATVVVSINVITADDIHGKEAFLLYLTLPALGLVGLVWGAVGTLRRSVRGARIARKTLRNMQGFLWLITCFLGLGHLVDPGSPMLAGGGSLAVAAVLLVLVHISLRMIVRCQPLMTR